MLEMFSKTRHFHTIIAVLVFLLRGLEIFLWAVVLPLLVVLRHWTVVLHFWSVSTLYLAAVVHFSRGQVLQCCVTSPSCLSASLSSYDVLDLRRQHRRLHPTPRQTLWYVVDATDTARCLKCHQSCIHHRLVCCREGIQPLLVLGAKSVTNNLLGYLVIS